jgi:alkylation response protein AidB-like acyl-CoA dehydrogenase
VEFSISDEQRLFYDQVHKFAKNELEMPYEVWNDIDRNGTWPADLWAKMGDFGLLGLALPEKYGGGGAGALTVALAIEAAACGGIDGGLSLSWGAHSVLAGVPIWKLGTDEQKQKYLPGICSGETIAGFAMTEPDAGSDSAAIKTFAEKKGDTYVLNGSKMFITNGPIGKLFVVLAVTDKNAKQAGITAFIVQSDFPGFSVGKPLDKMGVRISPTSELFFDNCEVPAENVLGQVGGGFIDVGKLILEWERGTLIAQGVGALEYMLKKMCTYSLSRRQFGRPISSFGAIKEKISNLRIWANISRQLVYRNAWLLENNRDCMLEAAIAKEYLSQRLVWAADECVQLFGGYGYMREYLVERFVRDSKLATIVAGTSEIQKGLIARSLMNLS